MRKAIFKLPPTIPVVVLMRKSMVFEAAAVLLLILLIFVLYVMIASSVPSVKEQWNTTVGQTPYIFAGDNGTLYVFSGNNISLITPDGNEKWSVGIPANWTIIDEFAQYSPSSSTGVVWSDLGRDTGFRPDYTPAVASSDGILYVYIRPNTLVNPNCENLTYGLERALGPDWEDQPSFARLMAISPDGQVLWIKPISNETNANIDNNWMSIEDVYISSTNDKIYVYHPYELTVLDTDGTILFNIDNVSDPAAVDKYGDIFVVQSEKPNVYDPNDTLSDYKVPSSVIDAYYPNGTLWWQKDVGEPLERQILDTNLGPEYWTLPLYHDNILYAPMQNGIAALNLNGTELWSENFNMEVNLLWAMPFDAQNNLYLTLNLEYAAEHYSGFNYPLYMIKPDGSSFNYTMSQQIAGLSSASNGIGYFISFSNYNATPLKLSDMETVNITANNLLTGKDIWSFIIPNTNIQKLTLTPSNIGLLGSPNAGAYNSIQYNQEHPELQNLSKDAIGPWDIAGGNWFINVLASDNVVYVSYYDYNYEYPASLAPPMYFNNSSDASLYTEAAVLNRSDIDILSGILALDNSGHLLWNRPTSSMVTAMVANNSTIYYSTENGNLSATQFNIAIGFALAAIVYLFLRFFCVGAVARAKASLNKNEKRNQIYDFIVKNPGLTIYELARGTKINMGTARYHVFILGMNHRITSYKTEGKYVRYFTNSNSYSRDEQLILSVMRRDIIGKVLMLLSENPCMSITQISKELNLQESAVSRCIKELSEKGIITREPIGKKCLLNDTQREHINIAIKRINGE